MEEKQSQEQKLKELFEAAHKDPNLKMRLFENPETVSREWKVELGSREIERLKKVGAFIELSNEIKSGRIFQCNPRVCYPSTVWLRNEVFDLFKEYLVHFKKDLVFYPPDIFDRIDKNLFINQFSKESGLMK